MPIWGELRTESPPCAMSLAVIRKRIVQERYWQHSVRVHRCRVRSPSTSKQARSFPRFAPLESPRRSAPNMELRDALPLDANKVGAHPREEAEGSVGLPFRHQPSPRGRVSHPAAFPRGFELRGCTVSRWGGALSLEEADRHAAPRGAAGPREGNGHEPLRPPGPAFLWMPWLYGGVREASELVRLRDPRPLHGMRSERAG